jgi:hypothetical protein
VVYTDFSIQIYGNSQSTKCSIIIKIRAIKQTQSFSKQIDQFINSLKNVKNNKKSLIKNSLFASLCLIDLFFRNHLNFDFEKVFLYVKDYAKFHNIEYILENDEFMANMKYYMLILTKETNKQLF